MPDLMGMKNVVCMVKLSTGLISTRDYNHEGA